MNLVQPNGGGLATGEVGGHRFGAVVCSAALCLGCGVRGILATAAEGRCTSCSPASGGVLCGSVWDWRPVVFSVLEVLSRLNPFLIEIAALVGSHRMQLVVLLIV